MNNAVILAGGRGTRMGCATPKQFLNISGKTIIEYTIRVFIIQAQIDEIAVVCHPDYLALMQDIVSRGHYPKIGKILLGGNERYRSILVALKAYENDTDCLFIS